MRKLAIALGIVSALAVSQANAAPIFTLTGGFAGDVVIKLQNFESFTGALAPGSENFGILRITTIEAADASGPVWVHGQNGAEITGIFRDIIVVATAPVGTGLNVKSTGGLLDLYINPVGALAVAGGPGQGIGGYAAAGGGCVPGSTTPCYNGISNAAGGGVFLTLKWNSGIDPLNPLIFIDGDFDFATFPSTGDAAGYLDVTGGPYAGTFDTNGQITPFGARDVFAQNDFCPNGSTTCGTVGDWQLLSDDPVRASARVVPQPSTLALLGIALMGLAALRRKIAA